MLKLSEDCTAEQTLMSEEEFLIWAQRGLLTGPCAACSDVGSVIYHPAHDHTLRCLVSLDGQCPACTERAQTALRARGIMR